MKSVLPFKTRCCQCCHCVIQIHSPLYVLVIAACFWCKVKVDKFCCSRLAPIHLFCICCESESRSVVSDSLLPYGLYSPWNSQARILEWVAFPFSRGSSQPRDQTRGSRIAGGFFTSWATRKPNIDLRIGLKQSYLLLYLFGCVSSILSVYVVLLSAIEAKIPDSFPFT